MTQVSARTRRKMYKKQTDSEFLMYALCYENFGRFHQKKFKKITKKAITPFLNMYNSRRKPNRLIEMIVKHCLIIAYYIW